MSYQEQKNYVSLGGTVLIFGLYCLYVFQTFRDEIANATEDYRFWAAVILVLIPVTIVAKILIAIAFTIVYRITTKEVEPSFTDELDKLIELKATRNSFVVFVTGFLLAMGALVLDQPLSSMFLVLFFSGFVSEIAGTVTQLYLYRRGV